VGLRGGQVAAEVVRQRNQTEREGFGPPFCLTLSATQAARNQSYTQEPVTISLLRKSEIPGLAPELATRDGGSSKVRICPSS